MTKCKGPAWEGEIFFLSAFLALRAHFKSSRERRLGTRRGLRFSAEPWPLEYESMNLRKLNCKKRIKNSETNFVDVEKTLLDKYVI